MTREEKRQIIDAATDRAFEALSKVTSGEMHTEGAKQLLDSIASLRWMAEAYALDHRIETTASPVPEEVPPVDVMEKEVAPVPGITKDEIREMLTSYANTYDQLDIASIMADMGYEKLSEVPAAKYGELLGRVEATIEEYS